MGYGFEMGMSGISFWALWFLLVLALLTSLAVDHLQVNFFHLPS
jgi:hypothetical protein